MFRVKVSCEGITQAAWPGAISDVKQEFASRVWHQIVDCRWVGDRLILVADNDYDSDGEALADEFSDTVAAYAPGTFGYRVTIQSVTTVESASSPSVDSKGDLGS